MPDWGRWNRPVGFVGFGEAAFHLVRGLRQAGAGEFVAYDIHTHTPGRGEKIQQRAQETGTRLVESNAELARAAGWIWSAVTSDQAAAAASQNAPYLTADRLYADLNSVSPAVKQAIGRQIGATGARFVEIAMMQPVPPYGHRVPILAGGDGAEEFRERMAPFGMRIEITGAEVGRAAATKMFRSIMIKGLEALITECVLAAGRYGAEQGVFASLAESYPGVDWPALADYMIARVVEHGERRAREMEEVAETLDSIGIEPIMASATARRQEWSAQVGLKNYFGGEPPKNYREFLQAVAELESGATLSADSRR
ncbi:MAG: NAD(P)-dependent oxidoreductase [Acidobacteriia bacterium]|nr:NAD(P)-dependent oxidoreductase [Terriglobia bacterium]